MRFCLGTTDELRDTMTGFDCSAMADRIIQISLRMPDCVTDFPVAVRIASSCYL